MNDFFTWETLATYAGASLATGIVTQFIKGWLQKIPTQVVAYVIAVAVLLLAQFFIGTLTPSTAAMIPLNAILVATAAGGTYDAVNRLTGGKDDGKDTDWPRTRAG